MQYKYGGVPPPEGIGGDRVLQADDACAEVGDVEREVGARAGHEHERRGDAEAVGERGDVGRCERFVHQDLEKGREPVAIESENPKHPIRRSTGRKTRSAPGRL